MITLHVVFPARSVRTYGIKGSTDYLLFRLQLLINPFFPSAFLQLLILAMDLDTIIYFLFTLSVPSFS